MAITQKPMTAEELWNLPEDGQRRRLIAGELRTTSPNSYPHGRIAARLAGSLTRHVYERALGEVYVAESGFLLARAPDTVQAADVAFVRRERVDEVGETDEPWFPGAPDLAVEVISPNDRYTEGEETVSAWLAAGVRMVIVVNPRRRGATIYRPPEQARFLSENDTIEGEEVVPGWSLPVAALFAAQPSRP